MSCNSAGQRDRARFCGTSAPLARGMRDDMLSMLRATRSNTSRDELDELMLRRAAAGDATACRLLVESYQHRVFALVSRMLASRPRATVEDIAQDTFLQVFKQLAGFDPNGA